MKSISRRTSAISPYSSSVFAIASSRSSFEKNSVRIADFSAAIVSALEAAPLQADVVDAGQPRALGARHHRVRRHILRDLGAGGDESRERRCGVN